MSLSQESLDTLLNHLRHGVKEDDVQSRFYALITWCLQTAPDMLLTGMACLVCFSYIFVMYKDLQTYRRTYTQHLFRLQGGSSTGTIVPARHITLTSHGIRFVKEFLKMLGRLVYFILVYVCIAYLMYEYFAFSPKQRLALVVRYKTDVTRYIVRPLHNAFPDMSDAAVYTYISRLPLASFSSCTEFMQRLVTVIAKHPRDLGRVLPELQRIITSRFLVPTIELLKHNPSLMLDVLKLAIPQALLTPLIESIPLSPTVKLLFGMMTQTGRVQRRVSALYRQEFMNSATQFMTVVLPEYCEVYFTRLMLTVSLPLTVMTLLKVLSSVTRTRIQRQVAEDIIRRRSLIQAAAHRK